MKIEAYEDTRGKFDILYYIVALLYLIFDLEIIFLFPLSSIIMGLNNITSLVLGMAFVIILTIGFYYEWFNGGLQVR
jgi:NADH-quinone oxidoreductase subunit A